MTIRARLEARLIPNWRDVLRRAWSVRLLLWAGALQGLQAALPMLAPLAPDWLLMRAPWVLGVLTFAATAAAFVTRLLAQQSLTGGNNG